MFMHKTLKGNSFATRAKVVSPALGTHRWEFVMGALSRFLPRGFSLAGYPIVVTRQQYSTARIDVTTFQPRTSTPRYMDGLLASSRTRSVSPHAMKPFLKLSIIALSVIIIGGSSSSPLSASTSFSNKQIASYLQVVTAKLEQSQSQRAQLGTFNQAKLSCYSVLLGEVNRDGNHGLYTWFTCSGIHNAVLPSASQANFSCTGFSSAVWIQPVGKSVSYVAVTNTAQYLALRSTAPRVVQEKLSSAYNLVHQHSYERVVGHAIASVQTVNQPICS